MDSVSSFAAFPLEQGAVSRRSVHPGAPTGAHTQKNLPCPGIFKHFPILRHPLRPPHLHFQPFSINSRHSPQKLRFQGYRHLYCSDSDGDTDDSQGNARFTCFLGGKDHSQSSNNHLEIGSWQQEEGQASRLPAASLLLFKYFSQIH